VVSDSRVVISSKVYTVDLRQPSIAFASFRRDDLRAVYINFNVIVVFHG